MAQDITIQVTADGKTTVLFPGGGQQTVGGTPDEAVKALKDAYGDRVAGVVNSDKTLAELTQGQTDVRQEVRNKAVTFTENNSGYYGASGGETGYSQDDIQRFIDSDANKLGPGYSSVEEYVNKNVQTGKKHLSNYLSADEIAGMSNKQLLAANELYYQGNGDTGRSNGLSQKDLDWIKNNANSYQGITHSPNTQAISTGFDATIDQTKKVTTASTPTSTPLTSTPASTPAAPAVTSSSNTDILNLGQGEVAPVQAVPQVVTQQVTPPSYSNQPQITANTAISNAEAGTFSKPLQTAGLSAVPQQVSYKTHYAGTPGLVDPTLVAPTGGMEQAIYQNNLGQQMTVTEMNGSPVSYVPPGFVRQGTVQEVQQQSSGMAAGGAVQGYAAGGSVDQGILKIARMNGFSGTNPQDAKMFMNSSEGLRRKARAVGVLMNKGGLAMAQGGSVPNQAMIAGQPHRLAYVNPQEEAMMKAAGGAGVPSYGGIPAYFSLGPGTTVGQTAKDPTTGTVYTWNGTTWTTDKGYDVGQGMGSPQVGQPGYGNPNHGLDGPNASMAALSQEDLLKFQQNLLPAVVPSLTMQNQLAQNMMPAQANVQYIQPQAADFVPVDAGQATPIAPYAEAATVQTVQQANQQATPVAQTVTPVSAVDLVKAETAAMQPAQGVVSDQAQTTAQQQTTSSLTGMTGAQGTSVDVVTPAPRELQTGELIDPVANAASASSFTEQIEAQTATPSAQATVQGQLEGLMQQFEGGNTPAWAAGSMRNATAMLAARGLGASSLAGQAVIQATMEAALPIAQIDAQVQAQFEGQNLSNRQQRAMLAAQQRATFLGMEFDQAFQARVQNSARIGDIANMNFTAEQNIALENSRAANTMNLNNLSNRQAMIMSEAAALANLDMANLNNRQQAAVQNAQSFLQMDMANLNNTQQTEMFKTQQNVQALFTDQAAENAAKQFNASSQNQTDQYFANLRNQTSQFNASQQNAMDQFNVNSVNALREFNSQVQQQRDLFNAQNGLVIAQANAQWRQNLSTINTAAQNEANASAALAANAFTQSTLDTLWQRERDIMDYVYKASEAGKDRALSVVLADKKYAEYATARADAEETAEWETLVKIVTT